MFFLYSTLPTTLRTLAGIWTYASGEISLPKNARVMFLPQKPYLPLGTLRHALIYPQAENTAPPDDKLKRILQLVDLPALSDKFDTADYWSKILSLGEQQRIAFANSNELHLHKCFYLLPIMSS